MARLEVHNPVAATVEHSVKPAPHLPRARPDLRRGGVGARPDPGGPVPGGPAAFRTLMLNKEPKALEAAHPELVWLRDHPDLPLPVVETPECFDIAVVGGPRDAGRTSTEQGSR